MRWDFSDRDKRTIVLTAGTNGWRDVWLGITETAVHAAAVRQLAAAGDRRSLRRRWSCPVTPRPRFEHADGTARLVLLDAPRVWIEVPDAFTATAPDDPTARARAALDVGTLVVELPEAWAL